MRTGSGEGKIRPAKPARECALTLLEYADRTEQELRQKLQDRGTVRRRSMKRSPF